MDEFVDEDRAEFADRRVLDQVERVALGVVVPDDLLRVEVQEERTQVEGVRDQPKSRVGGLERVELFGRILFLEPLLDVPAHCRPILPIDPDRVSGLEPAQDLEPGEERIHLGQDLARVRLLAAARDRRDQDEKESAAERTLHEHPPAPLTGSVPPPPPTAGPARRRPPAGMRSTRSSPAALARRSAIRSPVTG